MNYIGPHHRPFSIALQRQHESTQRSLELADDFDAVVIPDDAPCIWECPACGASCVGGECWLCGYQRPEGSKMTK